MASKEKSLITAYTTMKILIVGKDSYIGNNIDAWLSKEGHVVDQLDVLNDVWRAFDYSGYDSIIHVAGIVHRPNCHDWHLYKSVNTDMPLEIASLAKSQGLKQYIYFSTMGVYGKGKQLKPNIINSGTTIHSESYYGKSKMLAEEGLFNLADNTFKVAVVRPPSVYGKGCKGGYIKGFTSIARLLPVVPKAYNSARQSFIYIDNLCECIRIIIENELSGAFCPQDDIIPNANELLAAISNGIGKKYHESTLLGLLMKTVSFIPLVKKAFGGIEYARELSDIPGHDYVVVPFYEGMRRTVIN